MCGIAGIWNKQGNPVESREMSLLNASLVHRGPDGEGDWLSPDKTLALVHRRLSILDLTEGAAQPMQYADGRYIIVYNGEIYNFIELRDELKQKGYTFRTECDTEVILAAYAAWKEKMLSRFNGMWALAIYDTAEKTLFLSRDRYAVKPLYYYSDEDLFAFASEVQSLHKLLGKKAQLDQAVIKDIAHAGFVNQGTERTYIKNVYSLPGGYNLLVKDGKVTKLKWYELQKKEIPGTLNDQAEYLKELLIDACKLRLRSDVPVATCLSGGVDSGSIVSIIHQYNESSSEKRFTKYSHLSFLASFPGSWIDEEKEAKQLAQQVGNELKVINIAAPAVNDLAEAIKHCDGPMHSLAFYPIWKLYKVIRSNGIKVTLDGQGPDEMLGGYRPIHAALMTAFKKNKLSWGIDVYKTYAAQGESSDFSSRQYAYDAFKYVLKEKIKSNLRGRRVGNFIPNLRSSSSLHVVRDEKLFDDPFNQDLYKQFFCSPLPAILNQYDRCSMASGVECRMPFMDYRIVEFIFSLPLKSKVGGGYTKRVLRLAMKDILPDQTRLNKVKIGFNAPVVEWFKGPLKSFMLDTMNDTVFLRNQYFDGQKIKADYEMFLKGGGGNYEWDRALLFWPSVHITQWLKMQT